MWFKLFKKDWTVDYDLIDTPAKLESLSKKTGITKNDPVLVGVDSEKKQVRIFYNPESKYYSDLLKEVKTI